MVVKTCNPSSWEMQAGGSRVQGQLSFRTVRATQKNPVWKNQNKSVLGHCQLHCKLEETGQSRLQETQYHQKTIKNNNDNTLKSNEAPLKIILFF